MDDTNTNPKSQNPNPNPSTSSGNNNQVSDSGQARMTTGQVGDVGGQQNQTPTQPVSGGPKEAAKPVVGEWVQPSTPEVVLPQEVQEAGVEVQHHELPLQADAQHAGITFAKEATPVKEPSGPEPLSLKTPHPTIQVMMKVHKSVKDSISWLLRLINKEQERIAQEKTG